MQAQRERERTEPDTEQCLAGGTDPPRSDPEREPEHGGERAARGAELEPILEPDAERERREQEQQRSASGQGDLAGTGSGARGTRGLVQRARELGRAELIAEALEEGADHLE